MKKTALKIGLIVFLFSATAVVDRLSLIEATKAKIEKIKKSGACLTQPEVSKHLGDMGVDSTEFVENKK